MPVYTSSIEVTADYPTIKPSLNLNFARSRSLDPRITFTRPGVGTYVGRDGLIKTAREDEARFDHDPVTLESLGLLIEESRTNIALYSSDFGNSGWTKNGGGNPATTVTTNQAIAPDGTLTADFIDYTTATVFSQNVERYIDLTPAGKTYTASIWIKGTPGQTINLILDGNGVGVAGEQFTLDGTWQRFSITRTYSPSFSTSALFRFGIRPLDLPAGTATQVYAWGAQVELGAFPTSYIPTSGAAVTRTQDNASITGASFSSWYNQTEGTIFSQHSLIDGVDNNNNCYVYQVDNGTNNEVAFRLIDKNTFYSNPSKLTATSLTSGSSITLLQKSSASSGTTLHSTSYAVKTNDFAGAFDGATVQTDDSGTLPSNQTTLSIGYNSPGNGAQLNGHIKQLTYYPQRLTNAQLQLLTS